MKTRLTSEKTAQSLVLLSGGLDSTVALYHAHAQPGGVMAGLSFSYGAKHNSREIPMAAFHCKKLGLRHEIFSLDFIDRHFRSSLLLSGETVPEGHYRDENMRSTVVPFRNGIMLAAAAGFAESLGAGCVVIGAHAGDHPIYPDCRPDFMRAMAEAIRLGTYASLALECPFESASKADLVRAGTALGVDFAQTWSCYKGGAVHCGKCGTCVERREAFSLAGIPDPTGYAD